MTWNEFRCPANLALFLPLFAQPKSTTESIRMPAARNPLKTQAELGLYGRSAYRRKTRQNGCPLGSGPGGRRFESASPYLWHIPTSSNTRSLLARRLDGVWGFGCSPRSPAANASATILFASGFGGRGSVSASLTTRPSQSTDARRKYPFAFRRLFS